MIKENKVVTRILSKKRRKILEKIVEKKKKKLNRADLLKSLADVQAPVDELKNYTSLSQIQTKGLKKYFKETNLELKVSATKRKNSNCTVPSSTIAGSKKKRQKFLEDYTGQGAHESNESDTESKEKNLNNIGLEMEESSDEEDDVQQSPIVEPITMKEEVVKPIEKKEEKPVTIKVPIPRNPATYVHVERLPEIQAARLKLPILAEEQVIMETINENQIIILAGETGSGKTTQVPQFLYEAGYAEFKMIGITEPRRVAAISMSRRVAEEMNLDSKIVSYLIRFEGNTTETTKIKFMTDGVLLKEIETDFLLSKYSVIILDEAHERSVYTDILLGLLSRIVPTRNKRGDSLKLIIMSATLRLSDFTENKKLFKITPPVINVESRQFPVTVHFNKNTNPNYLQEAYRKTVKIHTKLPDGGILVFLTGQQEVNYLVKKLRRAFPLKKDSLKEKEEIKNKSDEKIQSMEEYENQFEMSMKHALRAAKMAKKKLASQISMPNIDLDNYKLPGDDTEADLFENDEVDLSSDSENEEEDIEAMKPIESKPMWVLPLYSLLSTDKQSLVFKPPPPGTRLCVVATNIAETSLTIPNVKYVVDSGKEKTKLYDKVTGINTFVVCFTSKASANQRAGRAGRTAPGHCYRLYSSAVFENEFPEFSVPEIQKKPVDHLMLQMKAMGIDKVCNFPFPSPPDSTQLQVAENQLKLIGALKEEKLKNKTTETKITPLGKAISAFPVSPRYGKMLALSHQSNLLPYTISLVSALSVNEVLLESNPSESENENNSSKKWLQKRLAWVGTGNSMLLGDPMVLLRAVGASEYSNTKGNLNEFCDGNGLRLKAVLEIRKLRFQLTNEIKLHLSDLDLIVDPNMSPPSDLQAKLLRQIILAGMGDQIARRIQECDIKTKEDKSKLKFAYQRHDMEKPIFIHRNSVLKKKQPDWVVYQEVYEVDSNDGPKMYMRGITAIEPEWLTKYVPDLCNFGKPLEEPAPRYDEKTGKMYCHMKCTFGAFAWELPCTEIEFPITQDIYRYFAMFFINGDVCPKLKQFTSNLLSTPSTMIKTWSKLIPRTEIILSRLITNQISSRELLLNIWKKNKNFLLIEYSNWLPESMHSDVAVIWPPIEE